MSVSDLDESDRLDEEGPLDGPPYDVFLSYNSRDRTAVRRVAVWFDKDALPPGAPWMRELEARLGDSRACAVFYGPNDIVGWERQEMEVALSRGTADHGFRDVDQHLHEFLRVRMADGRGAGDAVRARQRVGSATRCSALGSRLWVLGWSSSGLARS